MMVVSSSHSPPLELGGEDLVPPDESSLESDNVGVPLGVQEHEDLDGPLLAVAAADEELGLLVGELGQARASLCVAPGTERAIDFLGLPPVLPWHTAAALRP